jgi:hypothetical protein
MRCLSPTTQISYAGSGGPRRRGGADDDGDVLPRTTMARRWRGRVRTAGRSQRPPEPCRGGLSCPRWEVPRRIRAGRPRLAGSQRGGAAVASVTWWSQWWAVEGGRHRQRPPPPQAPPPRAPHALLLAVRVQTGSRARRAQQRSHSLWRRSLRSCSRRRW